MKKRKQRPKKRTVKPDAIMNPPSNIHQVEYQEYQRYQKNLLALKKYYPELANLVEQTPLNQQYELIYTAQIPNLRHKPSNALYYSPPDLFRDAADQLNSLKLKNTRLALFLGFGLGYQLIYYMQHVAAQQNTNFILVLEKDPEVFKLAMQAVDLVPIIEHPGVKLLIGLAAEVLYPQMRQYLAEDSKYVLLKGIKPVYHLSSLRIDKDYYLNALRAFKDSATHQILNFGNDPHDSLIGVENMLDNLEEIIFNPGINLLFNKFTGKPGIVVSTGPSLNKNKHLLKGLEDKAVIVAADASLKILLEMGVKPHLVVALERTLGILKLLNGIKTEDVQDVYFAACPVINPKVYEAFSAPRLIVFRNFDHFKWLGVDRGILDIKLSAGNMAFKVLEALGCNPIILIGRI
ncbi:MAG: motility associated factor glycosyltransferase family protein [Syntrophomonadaceae bacterium]|nr:motility associated factor glycosyltransferase family protein [Syntrophomonadaceae bacterium]